MWVGVHLLRLFALHSLHNCYTLPGQCKSQPQKSATKINHENQHTLCAQSCCGQTPTRTRACTLTEISHKNYQNQMKIHYKHENLSPRTNSAVKIMKIQLPISKPAVDRHMHSHTCTHTPSLHFIFLTWRSNFISRFASDQEVEAWMQAQHHVCIRGTRNVTNLAVT